MPVWLNEFLDLAYWGNPLAAYAQSGLFLLAGWLGVYTIKKIIIKRLITIAERTPTPVDDFVLELSHKNLVPLLYYGIFYLAIQQLSLHDYLQKVIHFVSLIIIIYNVTQFLIKSTLFSLEKYWHKEHAADTRTNTLFALKTLITILLWSLAFIIFLDNLGIEVTGLVAGLGVSGVAVAFAAQAILKDVFSYFSIFLDKPFEIGDFIILDSFMGTVEHIGIKTTKVRSLGGEQLIFANADLTNARVRNFKRMWERRVVFRFGLLYETPAAQLREVPSIVRQIIESLYQSKFDRCHFFQFGDYSLIFETVYYVSSNDYNTYMDIQHEINLKLKEALEERGMGFAYPTQSVYLHSTE